MGDDSLAEDDKPSVKDEGCCCSLDLTDDEMVESDVKRCDCCLKGTLVVEQRCGEFCTNTC